MKAIALILSLLAIGLPLSAQPASGTPAPGLTLKDFDTNRDGLLSEDEYRLLQKAAAAAFGYNDVAHQAIERKEVKDVVKSLLDANGQLPTDKVPVLILATQLKSSAPLDANLDGRVDAADVPYQQKLVERATNSVTGRLNAKISDLRNSLAEKGDTSEKAVLASMDELFGGGDKDAAPLFGRLSIRESADINLDTIGDMDKAKPATLSFAHDFKDKGRETTNIKVALVAAIPAAQATATGVGLNRQVYYVPALAWEKINGTTDKDVDLLTVSMAMGGLWRGRQPWPYVNQLTLTGSFSYDREKDSKLGKLETVYTPIAHRLWLGSYHGLKNFPFQIKFDTSFKLSATEILDAGRNPKLSDHDDFWRIGGTAAATIRPSGAMWDRWTFSTAYTYQSALSGRPKKAALLDVSLQLQLDNNGHYSFGLNYQDGDVTILDVPTDKLTLKLGVKY